MLENPFPNWFQVSGEHNFSQYLPQKSLRVLQIGAFTGDATEWLLNNRDIELIEDVDTWAGSDEDAHHSMDFSLVESVYDRRMSDNPKVLKRKMTSDAYFAQFPDSRFNFIYIDGDHTALQTALDGLNAWRLLESGGIMAFDDYLWNGNPDPFLCPWQGIEGFTKICRGQFTTLVRGYQVWVQKC